MATKQPKREDVKLNMPNQTLQVAGSGLTSSFTEENVQPVKSKLTGFMEALGEVLPQVGTGLTNKLEADIQEDITLQESRRLMGLDPTADATSRGRLAAKAVDVKNSAYDEVNRLAEVAKNFSGTDEEWDALVAQSQNNVYSQTGNTPELIKASASVYRQGLPKLSAARQNAKETQRQEEAYRINSNSLVNAVESAQNPQHMRANVSQILKEMDLQGIPDIMVEKTIVDTAASLARNNGDTSLIDFIKEQTNWYQENPVLLAAYDEAVNKNFKETFGEIAQTKTDIETKYSNDRRLTKEQWFKEAGALRKLGKPIYTVEQLMSSWDRINKENNEAYRVNNLFNHMVASQDNPEADPLPFVGGDITNKEAAKLIKKWDTYEAEAYLRFSQGNNTEEELALFKNKQVNHKAHMLARMGIKDQNWVAQFSSIEDVDLSELSPGKDGMPNGIRNALVTMDYLDDSPAALSAHASTDSIAIHSNFKKNLANGMDELLAYQMAHRTVKQGRNRVTTQKDRKSITNGVSGQIDDLYDNWFFSDKSDVGTNQRGIIQYELESRAEELFKAGMSLEDAVKTSAKEYENSSYQLMSGHVIKGDINNIARIMEVSPINADKYLSELPEKIVEDFELEDGFVINPNVPTEEWIPKLKPNGTIVFTDYYGAPVTMPLTLGEVSGKSIRQQIEEQGKRDEEIEKVRAQDSIPYNMTTLPMSGWDK